MAKTIHQYETELARLRAQKAELANKKATLSADIAALTQKNQEILKQVYQINNPSTSTEVVFPQEPEKMKAFAHEQRKVALKNQRKHERAAKRERKERVDANNSLVMGRHQQVADLVSKFDENMYEQGLYDAEVPGIDSSLAKLNTLIATEELELAAVVRAQPKAAVAPQAAEDDDILAASASSSSSSSLSSSSISTISSEGDEEYVPNVQDEDAAKTRKEYLYNLLNAELDAYDRSRSPRFEYNKLSSLDEALARYNKAAKQEDILSKENAMLELINKNINQQLSVPVYALLNRMKLAILVYDHQYRSLNGDLVRYLRGVSPKIEQNIPALYAQLDSMAEYAQKLKKPEQEIVGQLALDLKRDLNDFVASSFDQDFHKPLDTDEMASCFNDFKERFTARLHSQDHMMTQHTKKWRPIVANILAGVATLGIALGVKLIYSRVKEGHASFFMGKTGKEQQVKRVEDTLKNFDDKPNKGPGHQGG